MANDATGRALLIHHGAIGDFLVASRLMELADNHFGPFRWDLLGKPHLGRLAKSLALIEEHYDFSLPGWHLFFSPDLPIDPACRTLLNRYDLIVNVVAGPNSVFSQRIREVATNRVISIEPKPPENDSRHVYQFLAQQVIGRPIDVLPSNAYRVDPALVTDVAGELRSRRIDPATLFLIHPGASGAVKRLPLDYFIEFARSLGQRGIVPAFLLGEVELEQFGEAEIKRLETQGLLFAGWSLERLAALIARVGKYLGNDNGISHLAAVVGAQTQVIFVRDNARNWKPLGPRVTLVPPKLICS